MTRYDILTRLPYFIEHPRRGEAELEAYTTEDGYCLVHYRHANKSTSYATWARTWKEVYDDIRPDLVRRGYIE